VFDALARILGGRPAVSATLIAMLGLSIVIGPASWLVFGLVEGVRFFSDQLGAGNVSVPVPNPAVKEWPLVGERLFDLWQLASTNLAALLGKFSPYAKPVATTILSAVGGRRRRYRDP
jgi:predicted PurR-regulated permease PerM